MTLWVTLCRDFWYLQFAMGGYQLSRKWSKRAWLRSCDGPNMRSSLRTIKHEAYKTMMIRISSPWEYMSNEDTKIANSKCKKRVGECHMLKCLTLLNHVCCEKPTKRRELCFLYHKSDWFERSSSCSMGIYMKGAQHSVSAHPSLEPKLHFMLSLLVPRIRSCTSTMADIEFETPSHPSPALYVYSGLLQVSCSPKPKNQYYSSSKIRPAMLLKVIYVRMILRLDRSLNSWYKCHARAGLNRLCISRCKRSSPTEDHHKRILMALTERSYHRSSSCFIILDDHGRVFITSSTLHCQLRYRGWK